MKADRDKGDAERVTKVYEARRPLLKELALRLKEHTRLLLEGTDHIDRVYFRAKDTRSFVKKSLAVDETGQRKYAYPEEDIEDQVAGRVLVFFRRDIEIAGNVLNGAFNRAEQLRKAPKAHDAFAYESEHFVFIIPPHVTPSGWDDLVGRPTTFEMQVRTLFMHAWAELEHDMYKAEMPLTPDEKRKLAWAASSAWGGDAIFEQVLDSLAERAKNQGDAE